MTMDPGPRQSIPAPAQDGPLLDSLLDLSGEATLLLAPDGRLVRLNAAAERLLGVRAADWGGRLYHEWPFCLHEADGADMAPLDVGAALAEALSAEAAPRDVLLTDAAGARLRARLAIASVRDGGELLGFWLVFSLTSAVARADELLGVLKDLPVGIIVMDLDCGPMEANAAACRLLGAPVGKLDIDYVLGRITAVYDANGELLTAEQSRAIWERLATTAVQGLRLGLRIDAGPPRWLDISAQPFHGAGAGSHSVITLADVGSDQMEHVRLSRRIREQQAALHQAEAQVRANQEEIARYSAELATHLDSVIQGVLVTAADGEPIAWNSRFREMFALPLSRDRPLSWADSFPLVRQQFVDSQAVDESAQAVLADPQAEAMVEGELTAGRSVVLHTLPVRGRDDPRIYGRMWVFRDVTALRREQRLAEEQVAFMQRILDWIPANVFVRDEQGRYLLANRATARAYGLTVAQLIGKTDAGLRGQVGMQPQSSDDLIETDRQIISGERDTVRYEFPSSNMLNGRIDYTASKTAFTWPDGRRVVLGVSQDVTAQRHAEREVIARQQMLQEIIDLLPANVFIKDAAGRYVVANEATARVHQLSVDELLGKSDRELSGAWGIPEELADEMLRSDQRVLAGEVQSEFQLTAANGKEHPRYYYVTKAPFSYRGEPAILGVALDLTAQREAEGRAAAQHAWFQQIFDLLPGNVYVRDEAGRYLLANRNMALAFGLAPEDLLGRTDRELAEGRGIDLDWIDQIERTDSDILDKGAPLVRYEFQAPDSSGRTEYFMITKVPFALLDGAPAVLGVSVNITREVDADLMEQQLDLIYDTAPIGIALIDRQGICWRVNEALTRILSVSSRRALEGINVYTHPFLQGATVARDVERCLEYGEEVSGEFVATLSSGQVVLRYGLTPCRGVAGDVGAQMIVEDITAYHRLQERVAQAAKLEALGQLAGGAAHSFRNMLTIIIGFVETALRNKRLSPRLRGDLEQVLEAGQRAADLARQLLTFSRRNELELSVFDLNELLRKLARMLPSLLGSTVRLELALSEQPLLVHADRAQVEQMVINLAANARQAMPTGGVLTIATRARRFNKPGRTDYLDPQPGRYAKLEVADTGTGLTPEARAHLFEPFFTTKPEGQGTGLGLSTAYGLMQSLGGGIDVSSVAGQGARFRFYLPRISPQEAEQAQPTPPRGLPRARHNELLLVVDGDDKTRGLLLGLLSRQLGYIVFDAASATEALAICDEIREPFDLVLTEALLPDLPGPELIRRLNATCHVRHVLYATADEPATLPKRAGVAPEATVLHKPFTLESVAQAVRVALDAPPLDSTRQRRPHDGNATSSS